jgi:uroporphyrinogen-III decarboxylase
MTDRERILAIMEGRSPDRIPWIPRMLLWWLAQRNAGTLPDKYEGWTLRDIERDLGMGTAARNGRVFTTRCKNVETAVRREGMNTVTDYVTPVGTVSSVHKRTARLDQAGISAMEVKKRLQRPEDYDVMTYIVENTEYFPCYEEYDAYEREIGDEGYPLVNVGDGPFHTFLEGFAGYEKGYMDLADYPDKVERLTEAMAQKHREELWPVVANSPARLIMSGGHYDTQMTPSPMFKSYITPYYQEMSAFMHKHDKVLVHHADADSSGILDDFKDAGYDMLDCFATAPLVKCTLKEAREAWGADMIIWGGIPSILMEDDVVSDEEFEEYMTDLFATIAPGDAFILGVADNVTAKASLSRVLRVGEMVEEYGKYPIQV